MENVSISLAQEKRDKTRSLIFVASILKLVDWKRRDGRESNFVKNANGVCQRKIFHGSACASKPTKSDWNRSKSSEELTATDSGMSEQ